jgi:hypothetical protein
MRFIIDDDDDVLKGTEKKRNEERERERRQTQKAVCVSPRAVCETVAGAEKRREHLLWGELFFSEE